MNSLNSILLEGNFTKDPVLHETPKGTPVCTFSLAVNRYYRSDEETVQEVSFFEIETWSRLAQYCSSQFEKGSAIRVVGRLKQDRWEDLEGNSRAKVKVIGEHIEPIEKKSFNGKKRDEEKAAVESVSEEDSVDAGLDEINVSESIPEEVVV
ncbi:MAG: single-stranded DNA-binding protein [Spirochaetales bacterium]|nr:single-stranded DNA-binding protein [Spirochaetales bacterium]